MRYGCYAPNTASSVLSQAISGTGHILAVFVLPVYMLFLLSPVTVSAKHCLLSVEFVLEQD